ncbi:hypothetical protein POTOM_023493 [Populus tomentosa]|uniref:Uncharacterized protein n=1 Tax=Populus tomentosa TaxID=118781 RepID=A0A8X7ZQC3_POPTO|nr:hypothetical protein POTOM_023493 [Populus tomentosa]
MCHPGVLSVTQRNLVVYQRRLVFQAVETETASARTEVAAGGGSAISRSINKCLCSPTRHPGSFRCRHHRSDYVWSGRIARKKQLLEKFRTGFRCRNRTNREI